MEFSFEKRIVAFLDILGFKKLVTQQPDLHSKLLNIIHFLKDNNSDFKVNKILETNGTKLSISPSIMSISDSIVLTAPLNHSDYPNFKNVTFLGPLLMSFSEVITNIYRTLLPMGIALRGAISIGDIYYNHDKSIIMGAPLIEAIEAEHTIAIYPRTILTESALSICKDQKEFFETIFRRDIDGIFHVDFFRNFFRYLGDAGEGFELIIKIRNEIEKNINNFSNNLKILAKWQWLANLFDIYLEYWRKQDKKYKDILPFQLLENNFEKSILPLIKEEN